ncbi:MAG TPA: hypothetical protein VGR20_11510 [Acidimicrobiia bacterium]|jgi:hypothetical protein|nr:hypothetical protein [Acidimicrobiia bacterium]
MGREATGTVRIGDVAPGKAKVLLETDELIFRGETKGRVAFRALTTVEPGPDGLRLVWPDGEATVDLAEAEAARWADRIENPPSLLDKLGVKDGTRVAVLDPDHLLEGDGPFAAELAGRTVELVATGPADVVVWALDEAADLARLPALIGWIEPAGALWAVWAKGRKELNENHVREAALDAGLVDVKVARFSPTHSALKLVVPKAKRGARHGPTQPVR